MPLPADVPMHAMGTKLPGGRPRNLAYIRKVLENCYPN